MYYLIGSKLPKLFHRAIVSYGELIQPQELGIREEKAPNTAAQAVWSWGKSQRCGNVICGNLRMRLYFFLLRLLGPLARLLFDVHYRGTDHIPSAGPLIVCCNHRSVIDPLLLAVPFRRQLRFMAKSELFEEHGRLAAWFLRTAGAFPVQRDKGTLPRCARRWRS